MVHINYCNSLKQKHRITAVVKVETDIIPSIVSSPTGRDVIIMIMSVEISNTDIIPSTVARSIGGAVIVKIMYVHNALDVTLTDKCQYNVQVVDIDSIKGSMSKLRIQFYRI